MTKEVLAKRISFSASKIAHILQGTCGISRNTASLLEKTVGVPAHIWTGLDKEYQLARRK
jgi:HTH-type transcriptional regulator/antitoxin HigA